MRLPPLMRSRPMVIGALIAALLVVTGVALFEWNMLRGPIERFVTARTGRALEIGGSLHVRLGRVVHVSARDVRYANPAWASEPWLAQVAALEFDIPLGPLIRGRPRIDAIQIEGGRLALEENAAGARSWSLGRDGAPGRGPSFALSSLGVRDTTIRYHDAGGSALDVAVESASEGGATLSARGTLHKAPVEARFTTAPLRLRAPTEDGLRFDGAGTVAGAKFAARGRLGLGDALAGTRVDFSLAGPDLALLRPVVQAALPATPPYELHGAMTIAADAVSLRFDPSKVGDSRLSGELAIAPGRPAATEGAADRTRVRGKIVAAPLDFDDLGPLFGTPPGTKPGESASPAQRAQAARNRARERVLPEAPFHTELWPKVDFDITFEARRAIDAPKFPIDGFTVHVALEQGTLRLAPLDVAIAGGRYHGDFVLAPQGPGAHLQVKGNFSRLNFGRLLPRGGPIAPSDALIDGTFAIDGRGRSFREVLAGGSGELRLVMGAGEMSNLLLELVGLDAFESLKFLLGGDKEVKVRCAVAALPLRAGRIEAQAVVFDTADTNVVVTGSADLAEERLDFTLHPAPKDWSLVSLRAPLHLRGSFARPQIEPDASRIASRGIAAILLGLANPVAALAPLIDLGGGKDHDCNALIQGVRGIRPPPGRAPAKR